MFRWIILLLALVVLLFLALFRVVTDTLEYHIISTPRASDALGEFPMGHNLRSDRILEQIEYLPAKLRPQPVVIYVPNEMAAVRASQHELRTSRCRVANCILSSAEVHRPTADVVFFSPPTSSFSIEYPRPPHQLWVMQLLESPENTMNLSDFNGRINYTASYRYDSDLVTPYGKWVSFEHPLRGIRSSRKPKTKKVLWLVSHCITNNARMRYANELARYISVDVFGDCGERKLPKEDGIRLLREEYKFYLAFENSNCEQYVTEKFFDNALKNGAVPIVMGAPLEFYESVAPPHSFIHVDQFRSPKELAQYLQYLDSNEEAYNDYFKWQRYGEFVDTKFWCRLCSILQQPKQKIYADIEQWWHSPNQCNRRHQGYT
ncbi:hypothetical protein L596_003862 [Steinernema carpocapsae]|uniref:Fucosyltransferase n=1 Tax=Steinernema carpocapsae TaxID=34508 RepID=A0A4U8UXZ9_STECR|nr:hypothetical protein L596_003862 [Steinernema carpocapsae]